MGVATANSILVISFARERLAAGADAIAAALDAGSTPACADDGARDDHRHGADGDRARPKRAARSGEA